MDSEDALGIIAGAGELPLAIADAAIANGRKVFVLGLEGLASPADLARFPHALAPPGEFGKIIRLLRGAACAEVTLAGRVPRPKFHEVRLDMRGAFALPKIIAAAAKGDDALLRALLDIFEKEGFRVIGSADAARDLLAPPGPMTKHLPSDGDRADIARALQIVRALGALDVGQAALVCDGLALAVEAAEGTDAMLRHAAELPETIRGTSARRRGVLVKAVKPKQERRVDLPVIGTNTIALSAAAGVSGIAIEAGSVLILHRRDVVRVADEAGIFLFGFTPADFPAVNAKAPPQKPLTVMLVAGEPSGDSLGAELMQGLAIAAAEDGLPPVNIVGVGGEAMTRAGLKSLFPLDATSVMGLREVVPRIPEILRRVRVAADFALQVRPDLVVVIDSPDFTHRVAQRIKRLDPSIRTANYAPPQVWASRSYRARKMARYIDAVLTLFPFETTFFQRHGIEAYSVGYPVIERGSRMIGGDALRTRLGIAADAPLLAVLPGSRRNEIRFLLPVFKDAVRIIAGKIPGLVCVTPTVSHVAHAVRAQTADWPTPIHVLEGEADKFAAFDAADIALAASGTVTTELALAQTPMVVAYRVGWITYAIARPLVSVAHMVLLNLVLEREAIPEFLQGACTPRALADALFRLFTDETARAAQLGAMETALQKLGQGEERPSLRAARAVVAIARKNDPQSHDTERGA